MKRFSSLRLLAISAAAIGLALAACDTDPAGDIPNDLKIERYSGNSQHERVGSQLPAPLVVRVRSTLGDPRANVVVTFSSVDAGAHVSPPATITDAAGFASCNFQLGTNLGLQRVRAAIDGDTTTFSAYADAIACSEESPEKVCLWPAGHIFVATTGSTLLPGAGSVILDVDVNGSSYTEVLQTTDLIDGISFSSRGELFVSKENEIDKVSFTGHALETYKTGTFDGMLLEPSPGGVLVGLWQFGALEIGCQGQSHLYLIDQHIYPNLDANNLAIDPVTRDLFFITASSSIQYTLWRIGWDGRTTPQAHEALAILQVGASSPAGMCVDSTGTVYIVFDGNDNYRRIVRVSSDGSIDYDFFDLYAHGGNAQDGGRWGDIAYLNGRLYLIDKRNDRLVTISRNGVWLGEMKSTVFSRPLDESEHYTIAASPTWLCAGAAGPEARGPSRR